MVIIIVLLAAVLILGSVSFKLLQKVKAAKNNAYSHVSEREALEKAEKLAQAKLRIAEESAKEAQARVDREMHKDRARITEKKTFLNEKESTLEKRVEMLNEQSDSITEKEQSLKEEKDLIEKRQVELGEKLLQIVNKSKESIANEIKLLWDNNLDTFHSKQLKSYEYQVENNKEEILEEFMSDITQQVSIDYYADGTISTFYYENNKELQKVLGRNNELKVALEKLTEVEVTINEDIKEIRIVCLEPIRREVASRCIKYLLKEKHPQSIKQLEKQIAFEKNEMVKDLMSVGEQACALVGFPDLPKKIKLSIGKCKYRFSYGQNLLRHNIEMARLGELLAQALNADVRISKLACFLHDIGKVESHEGEQHHHISAELVKEYDDSEILYNAIIAHHYDMDAKYIESEIVRIADAISGSRPGARRYSAEEYFEKIRALEEIAAKPAGVKKAYAIQAGREVRVLVDSSQVTDEEADKIAKEVATEIEETMSYPGIITVQVIRETVAQERTAG